MATGTIAYQDQSINAAIDGLMRMAQSRHIMEDPPAIIMHSLHDPMRGVQAGDHQGYTKLGTQRQIVLQAIIGRMHDEVDREGSDPAPGVGLTAVSKPLGDTCEPNRKFVHWACIEGGKRSHDPGPALSQHQFGTGKNEHR
ncbi:hypothetical protein Q671_03175 [Halomonas sp. PBN3]|nr:hypothetical protein Q671_03175 [Halomonas sp. PBN3]